MLICWYFNKVVICWRAYRLQPWLIQSGFVSVVLERPLTKHVCCVIPDERLMSGRLCQQRLFVYLCVGVRSQQNLCNPAWFYKPNELVKMKQKNCRIVEILRRRSICVCLCVGSATRLRVHLSELCSWKEGPQVAQLPEVPALISSAARSPPADPPPHPGWRLHWTG